MSEIKIAENEFISGNAIESGAYLGTYEGMPGHYKTVLSPGWTSFATLNRMLMTEGHIVVSSHRLGLSEQHYYTLFKPMR